MALLRVLLGFADASAHVIEETAGHILAGLYDTATAMFPAPPVTGTALQAALTTYNTAIAAAGQGGSAARAAREVAQDALIGLLRQDAL